MEGSRHSTSTVRKACVDQKDLQGRRRVLEQVVTAVAEVGKDVRDAIGLSGMAAMLLTELVKIEDKLRSLPVEDRVLHEFRTRETSYRNVIEEMAEPYVVDFPDYWL